MSQSTEQPPRRGDKDPFSDLDPYFERLEGSTDLNVYENDSATERDEHHGMCRFFARSVKNAAKARGQWLDDYRKYAEGAAPEDPREKQTLDRIFGPNVQGGETRRRVLAGRGVHLKGLGCYVADLSFHGRFADAAGNEDDRLCRGLFRPGDSYKAIVRFSNGNSRLLEDYKPAGHGMAVKLLPPDSDPAQMTADQIRDATLLNFAGINFPVTFMFDPHQYNEIIRSVEQGPDRPIPVEPKTRSEQAREGFGKLKMLKAAALGKKGFDLLDPDVRTILLLLAMNGRKILNPLFQDYHSMSAFRLGGPVHSTDEPMAVKYRFTPSEGQFGDQEQRLWNENWGDWAASHRVHLNPTPDDPDEKKYNDAVGQLLERIGGASGATREDYLRPAGERFLMDQPFAFDFSLHRFLRFADTPTEDPTVQWFASERERQTYLEMWETMRRGIKENPPLGFVSKMLPDGLRMEDMDSSVTPAVNPLPTRDANNHPVTVGRLTLQQLGAHNRIAEEVAEQLSFNVWDNVPIDHKPLGRVNRMRFFAYRASAKMRNAFPNEPERDDLCPLHRGLDDD